MFIKTVSVWFTCVLLLFVRWAMLTCSLSQLPVDPKPLWQSVRPRSSRGTSSYHIYSILNLHQHSKTHRNEQFNKATIALHSILFVKSCFVRASTFVKSTWYTPFSSPFGGDHYRKYHNYAFQKRHSYLGSYMYKIAIFVWQMFHLDAQK